MREHFLTVHPKKISPRMTRIFHHECHSYLFSFVDVRWAREFFFNCQESHWQWGSDNRESQMGDKKGHTYQIIHLLIHPGRYWTTISSCRCTFTRASQTFQLKDANPSAELFQINGSSVSKSLSIFWVRTSCFGICEWLCVIQDDCWVLW